MLYRLEGETWTETAIAGPEIVDGFVTSLQLASFEEGEWKLFYTRHPRHPPPGADQVTLEFLVGGPGSPPQRVQGVDAAIIDPKAPVPPPAPYLLATKAGLEVPLFMLDRAAAGHLERGKLEWRNGQWVPLVVPHPDHTDFVMKENRLNIILCMKERCRVDDEWVSRQGADHVLPDGTGAYWRLDDLGNQYTGVDATGRRIDTQGAVERLVSPFSTGPTRARIAAQLSFLFLALVLPVLVVLAFALRVTPALARPMPLMLLASLSLAALVPF